jgi:ATP-dependent exoDNAse (exonuclease V) alpha subunit
LKSRLGVKIGNNTVKPTRLYPKNYSVDQTNNRELNKLIKNGAENHTFNAKYQVVYNYSASKTDTLIKNFRENSPVTDELTLAIGSQVVFKQNIDEKVANGTRGTVIEFVENPDIDERKNVPVLPVVKLLDNSTRIVEFLKFEYSIEYEFSITKHQIPLKLAWAASIHSSQGSTLELVEADVGDDIFEYGQAYVVLSRVKTLEGLSLKSFNKNKIVANPIVLEKYGTNGTGTLKKNGPMDSFIKS